MIEAHLTEPERALFAALTTIAEGPGGWAVIGGMAVWCHLGGSHRPTTDIDAAARCEGERPQLLDVGVAGSDETKRFIGGVTLEVIPVEDGADETPAPDDPKHRLFLAAHWVAASHPMPATVHLGPETAVVPVAPLAALIGCKLHAWLDRKEDAKRGSDGVDILALLGRADPDDVVAELAHHPDLGDAIAWAAAEVLVRHAHRVARLIKVYTDTPAPTDDRIRQLGELLVDLCDEARRPTDRRSGFRSGP